MSGDAALDMLSDDAMLEEIELVTELVVAVSARLGGRLTLEEIDQALGL